MLNLNADNLLQGINKRVSKKLGPVRNMSINSIESDMSKVSKFSKFTIEDNNPETIADNNGTTINDVDDDLKSSPTNVKLNDCE